MSDCPEPVSLGIRASPASGQFLRQMTYLPAPTVVQLQSFARRMEMTIPQVATLATAIFIHRMTEAEDIVLGQLMAARMTETSRQTPAMVTNVLPLRLAIQPNMTVEDLARPSSPQGASGNSSSAVSDCRPPARSSSHRQANYWAINQRYDIRL